MDTLSIKELVGDTDIYLLDQVMKGRYKTTDKILDAGCGTGRNLHWFLLNNINVHGLDITRHDIEILKAKHPSLPGNTFVVSPVEQMIFESNYFDHVICSAVLHFAKSTLHFYDMMAELVRVLKPGGSMFIRIASNIGIENKVRLIGDGVYHIPDSSIRFLLTKELLAAIMQRYNLSFIEPLKTVNVNDVRCMSTLCLKKNN